MNDKLTPAERTELNGLYDKLIAIGHAIAGSTEGFPELTPAQEGQADEAFERQYGVEAHHRLIELEGRWLRSRGAPYTRAAVRRVTEAGGVHKGQLRGSVAGGGRKPRYDQGPIWTPLACRSTNATPAPFPKQDDSQGRALHADRSFL